MELHPEIADVLVGLQEQRIETHPDPARNVQHGLTPEIVLARSTDPNAAKDAYATSKHPQAPKATEEVAAPVVETATE